jgi:hypothetical protein
MAEQFGDLLYHKRNIFILSFSSGSALGSIEINEPIGWDKILISLQMDRLTWGYKFEFTDKDITLSFDDAAGRETLKNLFKDSGVDAKAYLTFGLVSGVAPSEVLEVLFEMQFAFDTYEEDDNSALVKMSLERKSFNDLLRSRWDIKTSLGAESTLDNTALTPLEPVNLWLHPIRLQYSAKYEYNKNVNINSAVVFGDSVSIGGVKQTAPPFKFIYNNVRDLVEPIAPEGQILYANLESGQVVRRVSIGAALKIRVTFPVNSGGINYSGGLYIYKKNFFTGSELPVTPPTDGEYFAFDTHVYGTVAGTFDHSYFALGDVVLKAGEAVFVKFVIQTVLKPMSAVYLEPENWFMQVTENSNSGPTITPSYRIFEAFNRQLEIITNKPNILKSNLLGRVDLGYDENGCGSHHVIFNGRMVRGLATHPNISANQSVNLANSLFAAGMSVERDNDGNEFVRIEELPYFFRDVELLHLDVISKYKKVCAPDYIYNELLVGFSKYPNNNQDNSNTEFAGQITYLTPIQTVKNKLEMICDFILSSLYIYYTQAQRFKDSVDPDVSKPKTTFDTDNDLFLVSVQDDYHFADFNVTMTFNAAAGTCTIHDAWKIPIVVGTAIGIGGTASNNGLYSVKDVEVQTPPVGSMVLYLDGLVNEGPVAAAIGIVPASLALMARTMEDDFTLVDGIDFPETKYNLEHQIKRIFYRWSHVIAACLQEKTPTQLIKFIEGKLTTTLRTQTSSLFACPPDGIDDPGSRYYIDDQDEQVASLKKALWKSNVITFQAPLSWETLNLVRKAFEGRHPDGKDYGYFSFLNPDGEEERGRLRLLKYEPAGSLATFELLEMPQDDA